MSFGNDRVAGSLLAFWHRHFGCIVKGLRPGFNARIIINGVGVDIEAVLKSVCIYKVVTLVPQQPSCLIRLTGEVIHRHTRARYAHEERKMRGSVESHILDNFLSK